MPERERRFRQYLFTASCNLPVIEGSFVGVLSSPPPGEPESVTLARLSGSLSRAD
jgi:hypothetical protein